MSYNKFAILFLMLLTVPAIIAIDPLESPVLHAFLKYMGIANLTEPVQKDVSNMTLEELGVSRGACKFHFIDFITFHDYDMCAPDDHYIAHILPDRTLNGVRRTPIVVKCMLAETAENDMLDVKQIQIMSSVKDIVTLLKPNGNATKRQEPGSCVVVFFYTETSLACAQVAAHANLLPYQFPKLRFAAIDAYKFPRFNTEFGVISLPTLLLFHQGRPVVRYYNDSGSFSSFVTRHTGIKSLEIINKSMITGPLPLAPVEKTDYILILAWAFILLCLGNTVAKSRYCIQFIDMIKRNWRESEAQLDNN